MLRELLRGRLVFTPRDDGRAVEFVGRGDMSRGGLMLRCAASGEELQYIPVQDAVRRGKRPAKLGKPPGKR
jgi:hypothetical protein